jgi:hypothetical protein
MPYIHTCTGSENSLPHMGSKHSMPAVFIDKQGSKIGNKHMLTYLHMHVTSRTV